MRALNDARKDRPARAVLRLRAWAEVAMGEYVIKCQYQSNRTQRYIRLHMSLSALILGLSLNDILAHG